MSMDRREFIKTNAIAAAAATAGISLPVAVQAADASDTDVRWDKAACRFCGTGCSVLVGVQKGRVVATQGDPDAPVNRGLNCIKGYFLSKIMYGKDRLTQPLLRMTNGKYDKNGEFTPISWDQAFDIMAEKWKVALANDLKANAGKPAGEITSTVGMFGSGQWTVWEGYAASKLWKAGFRSNNIDPNARHCMASAVAGFIRTFGIDEPMGCYDDLENADAFVLWGSNMAEMHPILWSRLTDRRLTHKGCEVHVLSTFEHRSFELADNGMVFTPQTDLAILNYIANYIIQNKAVNLEFVNKHTNFRRGNTDIGYGLRPNDPREQAAKNADKAGGSAPMSFDEYAAFVSEYTVEKVSALSGVPAERLERLAQVYADPNKKVVSFWTMGFNQHTRGSWANNLCYNIHLLTGKISTPGSGPFSLTGQPSACGTAREVGTFAHRLPADLVVAKPEHRARATAATHSSFLVLIILVRGFKAQQRCPKLVGCCRQQSLGLDAGLDRGVESDKVEGHVAYQCEVVGDVAGTGPRVIITELNIQTPVQPILDFPMTSDCHRNALGAGRQAADVVHALGTGALGHRSHPLDDGKAGHVLPGLGLVEPSGRVIRRTASHLDPSVAGARALVRRTRCQRTARIDLGEHDRVEQLRVVVFHAQHVVGASLANRAGDLGLRPHRIDGDDAARDIEHLEQFGNRRDLVGLLRRCRLAQHHAHVGRKRADQMQRRSGRLARGASARLPIDRDDLVFAQRRDDASYPGAKGLFELLRIEQREHALEGIGRGHAIVEPQKALQPRHFGTPPLRDLLEVVGPAEHRTHRHGEHFAQPVSRLLRAAPVLQTFENLHHVG